MNIWGYNMAKLTKLKDGSYHASYGIWAISFDNEKIVKNVTYVDGDAMEEAIIEGIEWDDLVMFADLINEIKKEVEDE